MKTIKMNTSNTADTFDDLPEYNFEQRVLKLRKKSGFTQEQMGELLGIDGKSYGKYEQGTSIPKIDNLSVLADFFGVSLDYLWNGTTSSHIERVSSLLGKYGESVQEKILNIVETMLSMMEQGNTY